MRRYILIGGLAALLLGGIDLAFAGADEDDSTATGGHAAGGNDQRGGRSKGFSSSFTPSGAYDGQGANVTQTKEGGSYSRGACCT